MLVLEISLSFFCLWNISSLLNLFSEPSERLPLVKKNSEEYEVYVCLHVFPPSLKSQTEEEFCC